MKKNSELITAIFITLLLTLCSYFHILPMTLVEVFGFITGAASVWLTVKENIWLWPVGIVGNIFFIILFFDARLYADMSLQIVYIVLGVLGWYWWLKGGENNSELSISRISLVHIFVLLVITIISTYVMMLYLSSIHDAAPLMDSLTTVLSLVAQYLLTRKYLENWYVWMAADVIYIYLYFVRELYLTGVLYIIFFAMCILGIKAWKKSLNKHA